MDHRRSSPARWFPRPVPGGGAVGYYVPFGWSGLFRCLGAQRPGGPACPAGVPISPEKWGERGPGASPLDPRFLWPLVPTRWFLGSLSLVRSWGYDYRYPNTDLERIFPEKYAEKAFLRKNISAPLRLHPPKPSPWGEGGPAKPGRMRGRFATQPFLVEKGRSPDCRLNEVFLLPRWATRSPPHQSPSVTASPQGEASGLCSPTRKSVPNQGTQMGAEIVHRPEQCGTQRQNERVGTSGS